MSKNLYHLERNDLFITEKSKGIIVYSIVNDIIKDNYIVEIECLIRPTQTKILVYNFDGRYYDPNDWFMPHNPHTVKYGNEKDKKDLLKMIFDYELDDTYWGT